MKPIVSVKDDPAKQITVFKFYVRNSVAEHMKSADAYKDYIRYCADAYNKVKRYNQTNASDWTKKLEKKLLKASIIEKE